MSEKPVLGYGKPELRRLGRSWPWWVRCLLIGAIIGITIAGLNLPKRPPSWVYSTTAAILPGTGPSTLPIPKTEPSVGDSDFNPDMTIGPDGKVCLRIAPPMPVAAVKDETADQSEERRKGIANEISRCNGFFRTSNEQSAKTLDYIKSILAAQRGKFEFVSADPVTNEQIYKAYDGKYIILMSFRSGDYVGCSVALNNE